MSYQHRLGTALDDHFIEFAVIVGVANVAAGIGLTATGYHFGAANVAVGVAVTIISLYRRRDGGSV